jgi:pSer/pThr/pTyr-binding forkhead associated (FHA) protein
LIVICEYGRLTVPAVRVALGDLQEVTVGRDSQRSLARQGTTATLSVPDQEISRKHLAVHRQPSGWEVADLGSKNGILVNGEPASSATLTDGDLIEAGGTLLMFREEAGGPDGATHRDLARSRFAPSTRSLNTESIS